MGFMIMQCGLGFFAAAIAHLILHGFYKAYLFLSAGAAVEQTVPNKSKSTETGVSSVAISLLTAIGAGVVFATLTGKPLLAFDSGTILVLVVVLTTLTAARDILHRTVLSSALRVAAVPTVVLTAITGYALLYNAISAILSGVPMADAPTELTVAHFLALALFVGAYLATEFSWHRSSTRLYVFLLNRSQPDPSTVLTTKEEYNDV